MMYALLAMAFYALEITITDLKLSNISPRLMTLYYSIGVAFFALLSLLINREPLVWPNTETTTFVVLMVLASFVAATAHFYAISEGVGTAKLTLVYTFLPVVGAFFMFVFRKQIPTPILLLAWLLAGASLYLVSLANKTTH